MQKTAAIKKDPAAKASSKSIDKKTGKFRSWLYKEMPLILSFLIPFFVMILVFIQRGIYPFGDRSFLRTDLYHQYAPFFKELLNKLQSGESLLYSWDIGNGSNFLALYCYYLSSPINWLLVFCPEDYVIEFITYTIVLKISLSGFTMAYYLKHHKPVLLKKKRRKGEEKENAPEKPKADTPDYGITMFAVFYALSGFMAAYSWNIMWLDCILIFPIIILGLEKLVKEDKCLLYCLTLAFSILTNYYIAIMICIALVFYFIMLLIIEPSSREEILYDEERGENFRRVHYMNYPKKILEFAGYSILAAGISCILLIPAYYALQMSASANSTFPQTFTSYFSIMEMLARHLDNVEVHLGLEHWPNIFCGVAVFIFIPLYVMNDRISVREKAAYFVMILFLLASFSMNFLNFIWHGFHYPNSLPCRQSFVYIFLLLTMAYKGYQGLRDRSIRQVTTSIWIAIGFILICEALYSEDVDWNFSIYYVSIIFVAIYGLLAYLRCRYKNGAGFLAIMGLLLVFTENFMNTTNTSVTTISRTNYVEYDDDYETLIEYAESISDSVFYRYEKLKLRTKNDGSWYQYPSISVFSSTANAALSTYYKTLGMEAATNAYSKTGSTLVIDMLFSVKYEFSNITYSDNALRKLVKASGNVKLYENTCALPLGFMVPSDMEDAWYTDGSNPIDTQNSFISASTGLYNTFKYLDVPDDDGDSYSCTYVVEEDGYYYAYLLNSNIDDATTTVVSGDGSHSTQTTSHSNLKRSFVLDIGYAYAGDTITITSDTDDQTLLFSLYVLQEDVLLEAYDILNSQGLNIATMSDTDILGSINVDEDGLMYTSIAYDEGWTVYVDGEEVETVNFKDAMLAIPLTAGYHTIHMVYSPQGFDLGIFITICSILVLILLTFLRISISRRITSSPFVEDFYPEDEEGDEDADTPYTELIADKKPTPDIVAVPEVEECPPENEEEPVERDLTGDAPVSDNE